jgi:hypothetical protein
VENIAFDEKNGKRDPLRFNVFITGQKEPLKLKADTPTEAEMWINGLNDWSNYFIAVTAAAATTGNTNARRSLI